MDRDWKHVSQVDKSLHSHKWVIPCSSSLGIPFLLKNSLTQKWELFNTSVFHTLPPRSNEPLASVQFKRKSRDFVKNYTFQVSNSASQVFIILTMVGWMWILYIYGYQMVFLFSFFMYPNKIKHRKVRKFPSGSLTL